MAKTKKRRRSAKRRHNHAGHHAGQFGAPKRRRASTRRTTTRRRARSYRRNPSGVMAGVVPFVTEAALGAAGVLGGKVIARKGRSMLRQQAGTLLGSIVEAGVGVAAGLVVAQFAPEWGERIAMGGLLAPMETIVQQSGVPLLSDSLGDDGFLLGDASGIELVSAYEDGALGDGDVVAGYIGSGTEMGDAELGAYIAGL